MVLFWYPKICITQELNRIFSEIDEPLDFNENASTNIVSYNDIRFFVAKLLFEKLLGFKVINSICNTEINTNFNISYLLHAIDMKNQNFIFFTIT